MTGRADKHQALSDSPLDLTAMITMLPCRGEQGMLNKVFEPLGYEVSYASFASNEHFPAWGESKNVNLTIKGNVRLRDMLKHIYVLIPVFDRQKHYWIGEDEVEKLLRNGEGWLSDHPEKGYITGRYLNRRRSLVSMAFAIVLDIPEKVCKERNEKRPDRDFGCHVITRQAEQLRRSVKHLQREGFRYVYVLNSEEEAANAKIIRTPLWNNKKH